MGDASKKVQAIEDVDRRLVGPLLEGLRRRGGPFAVLITPDHPTSVALRTHIAEPVPFAIYGWNGLVQDRVEAYSESAVKGSKTRFEEGFRLMSFFLQRFMCPACHYPDLWFEPWHEGSPSDEICPCCGIQFGYADAASGDPERRKEIYTTWRAQWVKSGMLWDKGRSKSPPGWNPQQQVQQTSR